MMNGLTSDVLSRACRVFLALAYPAGAASIPATRRPFAALAPDQPLEPLLATAGVCEKLLTPAGGLRGYAFRLGSAQFPHVKLQVIGQEGGQPCVFTVDTHDALRCPVSSAEAEKWAQLQADNRRLKERIEAEWERQGLLTFNALLRRGLEK